MSSNTSKPAVVAPMFVGRDNAEAVVGRSWRWCQDAARALGVPLIIHGRTSLVDAEKLKAALLASSKLDRPQANDAEVDVDVDDAETPLPATADDVLAALGKRRRSA